jgi:hypothetical protein
MFSTLFLSNAHTFVYIIFLANKHTHSSHKITLGKRLYNFLMHVYLNSIYGISQR